MSQGHRTFMVLLTPLIAFGELVWAFRLIALNQPTRKISDLINWENFLVFASWGS